VSGNRRRGQAPGAWQGHSHTPAARFISRPWRGGMGLLTTQACLAATEASVQLQALQRAKDATGR